MKKPAHIVKTLLIATILSHGLHSTAADLSYRSFHMGFAYQPYDWSEEAFQETFRLIDQHGDMIGIFFDGYVPWKEASEGKSYHPIHEREIEKRLKGIRPHQKVLLATSILANDRVSLAGNIGEHETPRMGIWKEKEFNDPQVIHAYLNYH